MMAEAKIDAGEGARQKKWAAANTLGILPKGAILSRQSLHQTY